MSIPPQAMNRMKPADFLGRVVTFYFKPDDKIPFVGVVVEAEKAPHLQPGSVPTMLITIRGTSGKTFKACQSKNHVELKTP